MVLYHPSYILYFLHIDAIASTQTQLKTYTTNSSKGTVSLNKSEFPIIYSVKAYLTNYNRDMIIAEQLLDYSSSVWSISVWYQEGVGATWKLLQDNRLVIRIIYSED